MYLVFAMLCTINIHNTLRDPNQMFFCNNLTIIKLFYIEVKKIMQQLSVNLTIPVPSDSVIISKLELQELKQQQLKGVYWSMKDLEKRINRKNEWIKENILYPSKFKEILDTESGGCVFYPKSRGQTWSFHALKMTEFLDDNFHKIFSDKDYLAS